jgi:hypothetical protein
VVGVSSSGGLGEQGLAVGLALAVDGHAHRDAAEPRDHAGVLAQAVDLGDGADHRLLHHVLGGGPVAHGGVGHARQALAVAAQQLARGLAVAGARAAQQIGVAQRGCGAHVGLGGGAEEAEDQRGHRRTPT